MNTTITFRVSKEALKTLDAKVGPGHRSRILRDLIRDITTDQDKFLNVIKHISRKFYVRQENANINGT